MSLSGFLLERCSYGNDEKGLGDGEIFIESVKTLFAISSSKKSRASAHVLFSRGGWAVWWVKLSQGLRACVFQGWEIISDHRPNGIETDNIIGMADEVADSSNGSPRNIRGEHRTILAQLHRRFGNNRNRPFNGETVVTSC